MKFSLTLATTVAAVIAAAPAYAGNGRTTFITDTLAPGGGHRSPYGVQSAPAHTQGYRFITDTLAPGGGSHGNPTYVTAPQTANFSWSDAAIGASAGTGALLVLAGSGVILTRRLRAAI